MLVSRVLDQRKRVSLRKLHRRVLMARKRDAQGAASSSNRRDQDRSSMRSSRTSRAASSSREGSVSQSGRVARGGRSALEGRPSRIGGDASSARSSRSLESSVRSRRDVRNGSQARTSAVRLAENPSSILRKRAVMPHGSGCRHALLQRSKSARLFQMVLSVHLRVLFALRRLCARLGALR